MGGRQDHSIFATRTAVAGGGSAADIVRPSSLFRIDGPAEAP
ncbi:hypothetical protein [Streptomyces sp. NPDC002057]